MLSIFIKKISMFFSLEKKEFISQCLLQTPDFEFKFITDIISTLNRQRNFKPEKINCDLVVIETKAFFYI